MHTFLLLLRLEVQHENYRENAIAMVKFFFPTLQQDFLRLKGRKTIAKILFFFNHALFTLSINHIA
jgi:hypothetical protein